MKILQDKKIYSYDLEVFPNFFSALFKLENGSDKFVFYMFEDRNDIPALIQFILQADLVLPGYNSGHYDDVILKYILVHPDITNEEIFKLSKMIIETDNRRDFSPELKAVYYEETPWISVDLMALLRMNRNAPGLKHCAIHLEHSRLQDLPKKPTSTVVISEIEAILDYNENDVDITSKLWHNEDIQEAINLRAGLGLQYNVNLLSADDSKLGNVILESEYGIPERKGTPRKIIRGTELIPPGLEYSTLVMREVLKRVQELVLIEVETKNGGIIHLTYPRRKRFEHIFNFYGTEYTMGKGGLHSTDSPRILRSNEDIIYRDCDVGSYYPMLRQKYSLVPAHLDRAKFLAVDKRLIDTRLAAKAAGDKVTADGLKICINGIFGKYNYPHFWLYDPLCFYQTTLYGQLFLLLLIEMLHNKGIETVSANTDGIVCAIPRHLESVYYETCVEWQKRTQMTLEYTDYAFLVQLNVNSYMSHAVAKSVHKEDWSLYTKQTDEVKTKKDFLDNKHLTKASFIKGYNAPIVALALQRYFKDGILPETTINEHENIHNFLYTQKTGGNFALYLRRATGEETPLQKTNRYYITTSGTVLVKKDTTEYTLTGVKGKSKKSRETSIWKGHYIHLLNDVKNERPEINKAFYIKKVYDIINKIEPPKRLTIFDFI